jgi:hypothetical protein
MSQDNLDLLRRGFEHVARTGELLACGTRLSIRTLGLHATTDGTLTFSKAGFLGAMTRITTLGDLDQLAPGTRVTFRWMSD